MSRYLCISVTFLDPLFHGRADEDKPEWPPSPMRLFQALLAGARTGCRNRSWTDDKAGAFRWLASQQPPTIVAPDAQRAPGYTLFAPTNDRDREIQPSEKLIRPHRLLDGDTLHYLWPVHDDGDPGEAHAETICREARNLMALGWGIDQIVGNGSLLPEEELSALPGQRWRPLEKPHLPGSQTTHRVPVEGSLEDLERIHDAFLRRSGGKTYHPLPHRLNRYDEVAYLPQTELPPKQYAIFEMTPGVAFRQENTARVAAMMRSLACETAKKDAHEFPGGTAQYVAGHIDGQPDKTPQRFSYLPLPSIGHPHADGMIRRLMIAEAPEGDGSHARWAQIRLRARKLTDNSGEERGRLHDPWRQSSGRMLARYVTQAPRWSTVTPIILPGHDDKKQHKAEKLLLKALAQAEMPTAAIEEMTMRKAPFWPGSLHPTRYFAPAYLRHYPRWHVQLLFRKPIRGPVAVGAGRHVGLGIFARTPGGEHSDARRRLTPGDSPQGSHEKVFPF